MNGGWARTVWDAPDIVSARKVETLPSTGSRLSLYAIALILVSGCVASWYVWHNASTPETNITGTITLNDKPLRSGRITFFYSDGTIRSVDFQDGQFKTLLVPTGKKIKVTVTVEASAEGPPAEVAKARAREQILEIEENFQKRCVLGGLDLRPKEKEKIEELKDIIQRIDQGKPAQPRVLSKYRSLEDTPLTVTIPEHPQPLVIKLEDR